MCDSGGGGEVDMECQRNHLAFMYHTLVIASALLYSSVSLLSLGLSSTDSVGCVPHIRLPHIAWAKGLMVFVCLQFVKRNHAFVFHIQALPVLYHWISCIEFLCNSNDFDHNCCIKLFGPQFVHSFAYLSSLFSLFSGTLHEYCCLSSQRFPQMISPLH